MNIQKILADHLLWLDDNPLGTRADFQGADLRYANLQGTNLQDANLRYANLQGANLRYANLRGANLQGANLQGANLRSANLQDANLQDANLQDANLQGANLQGANLQGASLIVLYLPFYAVYVQKHTTRIGCKYYANEKWLSWTPADVAHMDINAEIFWKKYGDAVKQVIRSLN